MRGEEEINQAAFDEPQIMVQGTVSNRYIKRRDIEEMEKKLKYRELQSHHAQDKKWYKRYFR